MGRKMKIDNTLGIGESDIKTAAVQFGSNLVPGPTQWIQKDHTKIYAFEQGALFVKNQLSNVEKIKELVDVLTEDERLELLEFFNKYGYNNGY